MIELVAIILDPANPDFWIWILLGVSKVLFTLFVWVKCPKENGIKLFIEGKTITLDNDHVSNKRN